jgi:hypothetical protein
MLMLMLMLKIFHAAGADTTSGIAVATRVSRASVYRYTCQTLRARTNICRPDDNVSAAHVERRGERGCAL